MQRSLCLGVVILLAGELLMFAADAPDQQSGWPAGWVALYKRFEAFLAVQEQEWPPSGLVLGEGGEITHGVPHVEERTSHVSLDLYELGRVRLSMGMAARLLDEGRERLFPPGIYAACLKSTGSLGYQHHFPFVWFQVSDAPGEPRSDIRARRLKIIPPPGEREDVWPNERILSFLDLHVLAGRRFPDAIHTRNELAVPSVLLRVEDDGTIERDVLPDAAADAALRWLVYHNGFRVRTPDDPGMTQFRPKTGAGSYSVMVGVQGAAGFLPISNILHFPLFPSDNGQFTRAPRDRNGDGTPDFVEKLLGNENPAASVAPSSSGHVDSDCTPRNDASLPVFEINDPDGKATRLLNLWQSWYYDLVIRPRGPLKGVEP